MHKKKSNFIRINTHSCIACWDCISSCPVQAIGKVEFLWHRHIVLKNPEACIGCGKCLKTCGNKVFSKI